MQIPNLYLKINLQMARLQKPTPILYVQRGFEIGLRNKQGVEGIQYRES
jgi:hypothetical protein